MNNNIFSWNELAPCLSLIVQDYGAEFQIHKLYYIGIQEDQLNIWTQDINIFI